jgi:hypothetical protein
VDQKADRFALTHRFGNDFLLIHQHRVERLLLKAAKVCENKIGLIDDRVGSITFQEVFELLVIIEGLSKLFFCFRCLRKQESDFLPCATRKQE